MKAEETIKSRIGSLPKEQSDELYSIMESWLNSLCEKAGGIYQEYCWVVNEKKRTSIFSPFYNAEGLKKKKKEELLKEIDIEYKQVFTKEYNKLKTEVEKQQAEKKVEEEKKREEEKRITRRNGLSNIKPVSFYEEIFLNKGAPLSFEDIDMDKKRTQSELKYDTFFEEKGIPEGSWKKIKLSYQKEYWSGDSSISPKKPEQYTLADNPEKNKKYLDRCKELTDILLDLEDNEYNQLHLRYLEILQTYLTEGYLITRQIAWFGNRIDSLLKEPLIAIPDKPFSCIKNHPVEKYKIDIYSSVFNINQINEDIHEFEVITKKKILNAPIEELKRFLKKHNNRITVKEYGLLINKPYEVSLRKLKKFVANNELMSKKVGSSHKLIFYV